MRTINVYGLLGKRVLVTRQSASTIAPTLATALAESGGELTLDFSGVHGVTPSFLDEILAVVEECLDTIDKSQPLVVIVNPPTHLSSKFAAVGRGHGFAIRESETGAWIIVREETAGSSTTAVDVI